MQTKHYPAGETIFNEGDDSDFAYYLVSGTVEVVMETKNGPYVLAELHAGEIFGEMGMINDKPRLATVRATTDVTVDLFSEGDFEDYILADQERMKAYLAKMFERLRSTDGLLQAALSKTDGKLPGSLEATQAFSALPGEAGVKMAESIVLESHEPLSPDAEGPVKVVIERLPFNIGRFSASKVLVDNDLYVDDDKPYSVSRGHCAIEKRGGVLVVRDRCSA